jgi:hypothetical protein
MFTHGDALCNPADEKLMLNAWRWPMTESEAHTAQRLQRMSEEVHIDGARHPDPSGMGLQRLVHAIETHTSEEAASVEAYRQLSLATSDPVVATLMRVLAEDEEHQHQLFKEIGKAVTDHLEWNAAPARDTNGSDAEWVRRVRRFEQDELRGARTLRDLAHRARVACEPLAGQLLEAMAMDSEKHARVLKFVGLRLARRGGTGRAADEQSVPY